MDTILSALRRTGRILGLRETILGAACILAGTIFAINSDIFLNPSNLTNIAQNSLNLLVISLGMSFILATAGIDISVGGAMGISAIFIGYSIQAGLPVPVILLVGLGVGLALGCVSAAVVVIGKVPPIIGTLGLFGIYRAVIFLLLAGNWMTGLDPVLQVFVTGQVFGIPIVLFEILAIYLIFWVILNRLPLGVHILAVGGDERAARLSGVNVNLVKFFVYGATGVLVGFAAILYVGLFQFVDVSIGNGTALEVIVASILGGATVLGGRASLVGTALGVFLINILQNGFVLTGVPSLWEQVVIGVLLLVVLAIDQVGSRIFGGQEVTA